LTTFTLVLTECVKFATCGLPLWASDGNVVFFLGDGTAACDDDDFVGFTM